MSSLKKLPQVLRPALTTLRTRMSSTAPEMNDRVMKYPYTLTACVKQFPYKFYWNHNWLFKYWIIANIICLPIFYSIQKLSYSPENVKKWEEIRRKDFSGHH